MDPNATLKEIHAALIESDYETARDLHTELINWLARDGFAPNWNAFPTAATYCYHQWMPT